MPENDFNKELNEIGALILKGGNAGIHKVITKLTTTQNPMLKEAIESMILQAAKNPNSPYALVVDKDGSINYNATSKISQISNPTDFISNLDEMEEKGIPFSEAAVEDIITDEIQNEIAEIESMAEGSEDLSVEELEAKEAEIEAKSAQIESKLTGIAKIGTGAALIKVLGSVRSKVASTVKGIFSSIFKRKDNAKTTEEKKADEKNGLFGGKKKEENAASINISPEKSIQGEKEIKDKAAENNGKETPSKPKEKMTIDEKIAEESKENPWIIPELRKGVKMKDGVEVKYNPVELKMEKQANQASDDLPGNIDDGPGSSDTENDFDDDFR